MADNPYSTPLSSDAPTGHPIDEWDERRGSGPLAMLLIGGFLGGMVGAVAGGIGVALMSVVGRLLEAEDAHFSFFASIVGRVFLGGFGGVIPGALLGGILGIVAGCSRARMRQRLIFGSVVAAALMAIVAGVLMVQYVPTNVQLDPPAMVAITVVCCGVAGGVGGWVLAVILSTICWGRPPAR